jgi:hypothetical protein
MMDSFNSDDEDDIVLIFHAMITQENTIEYSTTIIVKIKGKPRSLLCNKRTVIGKMMHTIINM